MKNVLVNYGGVILFYLVIVLGVLVMSYDASYLKTNNNNDNYQIVYTK